MPKKPRAVTEMFLESLIREQEERQIRNWLIRFRGLPHEERIWVMIELLREARASKDSMGIVREVVRRGHLLSALEDARIRMIRTGELGMKGGNPLLETLPVGAMFWRGGRRLQVTGRPRLWGEHTLIPVRGVDDSRGTLPGYFQVHRRRLLSLLDNPGRSRR